MRPSYPEANVSLPGGCQKIGVTVIGPVELVPMTWPPWKSSGGEPLETGLSRPSTGDWQPTSAGLMTPPKWPCLAAVPARQALAEAAACADPPDAEIAVATSPTANRTRVRRRPRPMCAPFTCFPLVRVSIALLYSARAREPSVHKGRLQTPFVVLSARTAAAAEGRGT